LGMYSVSLVLYFPQRGSGNHLSLPVTGSLKPVHFRI
jgi:hypothetical protein